MRIILTLLNLQREPVAILENAFGIGYTKQANSIWNAQFTLPGDDPKNNKINLLHYVEVVQGGGRDDEGEYIGLFRVIPRLTTRNANKNEVTYQLEHVLSTLIGNALYKYHQLANYTTTDVLTYLINQQKTKHWKLGKVDFKRYFHYSWENENVLSAILSVPKPFNQAYRFTWDTQSYPWTLNLEAVESEPTARIREGYNLQGFELEENPMNIWNRIYPLGAGEGVNQLDIKKVNNGIPYIEDTEKIAQDGLYEIVWADRRFENEQSLKESAEGLLEKWKEPVVTWKVTASDLSGLTGLEADKFREGKVIRMELKDRPDFNLRIVKEQRKDIEDDTTEVQLEIGNVTQDLGTTQMDLERRQQINELYSQGATNILNFGYQDNCDADTPATITFYIDDDVVNVNTIELSFRTKRFRAYSGVTKGGGALVDSTSSGGGTVKSTSSGGGTTATSSSGGGVSKSTESGGSTTQTSTVNGQSTQTSSAGGDHRHRIAVHQGAASTSGPAQAYAFGSSGVPMRPMRVEIVGEARDIYTFDSSGNHSHSVSTPAHSHDVGIPAHSHEFNTPNHSHSVTVPNHSHEIDIPNHSHQITIPDHTHAIKHEIVEAPETASSVIVKIDGTVVPHTSTSGDRVNLAPYISKDTSGNVTRGRHEITITPKTIARIEADVILRVFIRSHLGEQL